MLDLRITEESHHGSDIHGPGDGHEPGGASGPRRLRRVATLACAGGVAALALAACGSSSKSSASSSAPSSGSSGATSSQASAGSGADVAAAQAAIAPLTGHPTAFPVTSALPRKVAPGTKFVYLQCGAPTCAVVGQLLKPAIQTIGGTMQVVNAGTTATSSQQAASSALALKPKVVLLTGIQPSFFGGRLKQLQAAGAKVVSFSITLPDVQKYGISFNYLGLTALDYAGRKMADWAVANKGAKANVVFYGVPEITFTPDIEKAFQQELKSKCSTCQVRFKSISIATAGTTAPQTVANDLQSHPGTNIAVFGASDIAGGVPAALSAAGVSTTTLVYSPQPQELADIKAGRFTAGLGADFPVTLWTGVDIGARLLGGAALTPDEKAGLAPFQFLSQKDITFNPEKGWTGYPDFAQRFAKLWHVTK